MLFCYYYTNYCYYYKIFGKAISAIERFFVIGIMEEFNTSVELLFRRLNIPDKIPPIPKERPKLEVNNRTMKAAIIFSNSILMKRAAILNMYDIQLYRYGTFHLYFPFFFNSLIYYCYFSFLFIIWLLIYLFVGLFLHSRRAVLHNPVPLSWFGCESEQERPSELL